MGNACRCKSTSGAQPTNIKGAFTAPFCFIPNIPSVYLHPIRGATGHSKYNLKNFDFSVPFFNFWADFIEKQHDKVT